MGKLTAKQCNFNHQDQIWKDYVKKELVTTKVWKNNWGFLGDKYKELEEEVEKAGLATRRSSNASLRTPKLPPLQAPKQDTSNPFPQVTSREVGWRSDRKYNLEVFGRWGRPKYSINHQLKWPHDAIP